MAKTGHIEVVNTLRDTFKMRRVWDTVDGKRPSGVPAEKDPTPAQIKAAQARADSVKTFQLNLGSQDDNTEKAREEGVRQPKQDVPVWALAKYRMVPMFQHMEKNGRLRIVRAV